ncbi:MAG: hypothetical protein ABII06_19080 [Pseudomonadota bacterium]
MRKRNSLSFIGFAFAALLMMKVVISFFYLQTGSAGISTANLALAENKAEAVSPAKDAAPEDKGSDEALKKLERELRTR